MINFGQPRVGDATYAAFVNAKFPMMWRYTHNQDPVPRLPTPTAEMPYEHSWTEIYEDGMGKLRKCH